MVIFQTCSVVKVASHGWGRSLARYDDGLQKQATKIRVCGLTDRENEEVLERSTKGETRRSQVQLLPAPPKHYFAETLTNSWKVAS